MKKLIALLLAALMVLSLAACAGSSSGKDSKKDKEEKDKDKIVFEETTLIDNEQCTFKITSIEPDAKSGYTLKAYLENKSEDADYKFVVQNSYVNGVKWDTYFYEEVAAGKAANKEISFYDSELPELVGRFTDIELEIEIYEPSDSWSHEIVGEGTFHIYPLGEDKAEQFVYEPQSTDTVIADNDQFTAIVRGYDEGGYWGYTAKLVMINKTDVTLWFSADDVSVNGLMCDPFWGYTLGAGRTGFSGMSWSESDFEDNGITEVETIEMQFRVRDYDGGYSADDYFNETVTLAP